MPTVSLDSINNGDAADATPVNNNFQDIQSAVNNLDANNWATGKIFAPSKLTQEAATSGQALVWNGTIWAPSSVSASAIAQGGATTGQALRWTGSAWAAGSINECLGVVQYNPTTVTTATTTSLTGADVDATNLSLTVTLPGTKMLVYQMATSEEPGENVSAFWGIREATTDVWYTKLTGSTSGPLKLSIWYLVTGLVAGAHTYKWAFKTRLAANETDITYGTATTPADTNPGPAVMALFSVS